MDVNRGESQEQGDKREFPQGREAKTGIQEEAPVKG